MQKSLKVILAAAGIAVIGIVIGGVALRQSKNKQRASEFAELTRVIEQSIAHSKDHIENFNFEQAKQVLYFARDNLMNARFPVSEVEENLQTALAFAYAREAEFNDKINQGYVLFENHFIHSSERDKILTERKRAEEERRAAEQRREEKRQEELAKHAAAIIVESVKQAAKVAKAVEQATEISRQAVDEPAVDLSNWKPDPSLPKPEITAKVEIVKEPERKKVSMKVTATEANGLTVHEVQFVLKYRVYSKMRRRYYYPKNMFVYKMIPKIEIGYAVWVTPIVEKHLRDKAWKGTDDNWEVEIRSYNQYYKE